MTILSRLFTVPSPAVTATEALVQTPAAPVALSIGLPVVDLTIGMYKVRAEAAATSQTRETGLMFRKTIPDTAGMLSVFDESANHYFWMKNTDLPLFIAFITDDGTTSDIAEMKPQTEDNHCLTQADSYALEMNKGWLARRGVKPGMKVGGLPR